MALTLLFFSGIAFFTIRWWNSATFEAMHPEGSLQGDTWPYVEDKSYIWTMCFCTLSSLHFVAASIRSLLIFCADKGF